MDELCNRIIEAKEMLLKADVEANTVVLNKNRYSKLIKPGYVPTIVGLTVEFENLPSDMDFFVQRKYVRMTNGSRIREMSDERLASYLTKFAKDLIDNIPDCEIDACFEHDVLAWLKKEYK